MLLNQRIDHNFWVETTKDTCLDSSPRNLLALLEAFIAEAPRSNGVMLRRIREGTYRIDLATLDSSECKKVKYLCIFKNTISRHNQLFYESGIQPGAYLNKVGNFLFLFGSWETTVTNLVNGKFPNINHILFHGIDINYLSLTDLSKLEVLNLSSCTCLQTINGFGSLPNLISLNISACHALQSLPDINEIPHLSVLNIKGCDNLKSICEFRNHDYLENISITYCGKLNAPLRMIGLNNLHKLDVSWCQQVNELHIIQCGNLVNISGSHTLQELKILDIRKCPYIASFFDDINELSQLKTLRISIPKKLKILPDLDRLIQLETLDLSGCKKLIRIPNLHKLTQLRNLNLSDCKSINNLPALNRLSCLELLNLSNTAIRHLPSDIRNLPLRRLSIEHLHLEDIPLWITDIAESFTTTHTLNKGTTKAHVCLHKTYIDGIDMTIFDQPSEMIMDWFQNRRIGTVQQLNEIKVVFLGDGEAGKSHTIARLMNDGGEPDDEFFDGQSTPGVNISNKEYNLRGRTIKVHYWDFGGQEIMHSMHRIFLTERTMYVILLNARDDTQGDRARYWLHNVKSFAPDAPVLLVLNKIDQNKAASVDEVDLKARFSKLTRVIKMSARYFTQKEFTESFTNVLLDEIDRSGYLNAQWPVSWTNVKKRLENMSSHYILGDEYQAICTECSLIDNQKNLLHWFNDLGISFCCCDEKDYALEDYVILRPDWITNALYILLFNKLDYAHNGLIPHHSIYNILKNAHNNPNIRCTLPQAKYNSNDIQYVLGVMRKFSLSYTDGHNNEFIPMLCQQNSTLDVQSYQKDTETLEFCMHFDYLPNNLLHNLMVERYTELDKQNVWRTGARFEIKELGFSAVIVIDDKALRFFIRHTNSMYRPNTYLTMLKANVDRIVQKMGLNPPTNHLIYKLDGKQDVFDFETLKILMEVGQEKTLSTSHKKMIPITDILNQAAPENLEDELKLLLEIIRSCQSIQDDHVYHLRKNSNCRGYENGTGMEDLRNRRIRDDLRRMGFNVADQTQRGSSESGNGMGELDMLLFNEQNDPWTIVEALRVSNGRKTTWNNHLDKLLGKYNSRGLPVLYLLTYVDADPKAFSQIWKSYQSHIQKYSPGQFTISEGSFIDLNDANSPQYIKSAKCQYSCGGDPITVYHIFAQIPTQNAYVARRNHLDWRD